MREAYSIYGRDERRLPECCQEVVRTLEVPDVPGGVVHFMCQLPVGHDGDHWFDSGA